MKLQNVQIFALKILKETLYDIDRIQVTKGTFSFYSLTTISKNPYELVSVNHRRKLKRTKKTFLC